MSFDAAFQKTVGIEGGYVNRASDPGGETMYGITVAVARAHGYGGAMTALPLAAAKAIYKAGYWDLIHLDAVDLLSGAIAAKMFDIAVNCGVSIPVPYLQNALNIFNRRGADYPDLKMDGLAGAVTVAALRAYLAVRGAVGETVMVAAMNAQLGTHYMAIARQNAALEDYTFGWFAKRVAA